MIDKETIKRRKAIYGNNFEEISRLQSEYYDFEVTPKDVAMTLAILKKVRIDFIKARLETLSQNPVIIFDGGHNENAINNLRQNVEQYFSHSKKVYIISLLKTKDYKTIIKNICKEKDSIFIFTSGNDKKRYVSKEKLYKEAKKYLNDINMYKYELKDAINICKKAYSDRVILIVGSFYVYKTVCEVLKND